MKAREFWLVPWSVGFQCFTKKPKEYSFMVREVFAPNLDMDEAIKQCADEIDQVSKLRAQLAVAVGELTKRNEFLIEAEDILESVAAANGFSIPYRAKEWLKEYNILLTGSKDK